MAAESASSGDAAHKYIYALVGDDSGYIYILGLSGETLSIELICGIAKQYAHLIEEFSIQARYL